MIRSFRHRSPKRMYERNDPSRVGTDIADRVELALADLNSACKPSDLDLPGYRLSGNWRVIFRFDNGDVYDVNLVDYH